VRVVLLAQQETKGQLGHKVFKVFKVIQDQRVVLVLQDQLVLLVLV
jgi:UTP-glucose-1-phosphate uridylyltransferase